MDFVRLAFLVIYTFGVVAFAAFAVVTVRTARSKRRAVDVVTAVLKLVCSAWFVLNLAVTLDELNVGVRLSVLYVFLMAMAFLFPPLIAHLYYLEEKAHLKPSRGYRYFVGLVYLAACGFFAFTVSLGFGWLAWGYLEFIRVCIGGLFALFVSIGTFNLLLRRWSNRTARTVRERRYNASSHFMFAATILIFVVVLLSLFDSIRYGEVMGLSSRALPLGFIFFGTYYKSRFRFFDIIVKQGLFFFLTLILLTLFFTVSPILTEAKVGSGKPWVLAVLMLPLALALPALHRFLGSWLDRAWLGRQYSTVEAVKLFLNEVKTATSELDLSQRAERCLVEVFQARAQIELADQPSSAGSMPTVRPCCTEGGAVQVSIRSGEKVVGWIRMADRANEAPYFSQDLALLGSLADVFFSVLANLRLQQKKQEQEKREQELVLSASRSELKALRAQINPHFLFNALNAIAGLIQRDPERAEETVERLAEVFRYTLRRSENEWVRFGDEMDFIEAYLLIEQARFGNRLQVALEVSESAMDAKIPAMIVQTLVENAIKHGVASVRGTGIVEIRAVEDDSRLVIEVRDNGPGFDESKDQPADSSKSAGYGLRNVRERLAGYFGDKANLELGRDPDTGFTLVRVRCPMSVVAGSGVVRD